MKCYVSLYTIEVSIMRLINWLWNYFIQILYLFTGCFSNHRSAGTIWQWWTTITIRCWQHGFPWGRNKSRIGTYCSTYSTCIHSWRQSLCHGKWANHKRVFLLKIDHFEKLIGISYTRNLLRPILNIF